MIVVYIMGCLDFEAAGTLGVPSISNETSEVHGQEYV